MKILHLTKNLDLCNGITKHIFTNILDSVNPVLNIVGCYPGDAAIYFTKRNINIYTFINSNPLFIFFKTYKIIKNENISTVISHNRYFGLIVFILSLVLKIKTINMVHSKVFGLKYFSYRSDEIFAVSNSIKNHLVDYFKIDSNKIKIKNNYISNNSFYFKDKIDLSFLKNKFNILFVGRLCADKGFDLLLKSFQFVIKQNSNVRLLVVGEGNLLNQINFFSKDLIYYQNPIPDLTSFYEFSDLVVLPSRVDSHPIVALETIYFNKNIVATNVDGIPEILTNYEKAILIPPNNDQILANTILKFINDKQK